MIRRREIGHLATLAVFSSVLLGAVSAESWLSPGRAQDTRLAIDKNALVGSWELVLIRTWLQTEVIVEGDGGPSTFIMGGDLPYGPDVKGRLTFDSNGRFTSRVVNADDSGPTSKNEGAPKEFEASSGKYSIHPSQPDGLILEVDADKVRRISEMYLVIKKLTAKDLAFDTLPHPPGGWYSSFVYRRVE